MSWVLDLYLVGIQIRDTNSVKNVACQAHTIYPPTKLAAGASVSFVNNNSNNDNNNNEQNSSKTLWRARRWDIFSEFESLTSH